MAVARSSDPRFHDFDADFADAADETIPFKLMGKVWEIPGEAPAAVILRIQRLMVTLVQMEESGEVPEDMVIDDDLSYEVMLRKMVGDDLVDTWLTHKWTRNGVKRTGISYPMLAAVSRRLFAIYTGGDPDQPETAGKAPKAPQDRRPARKSSPRKQS
jgi:hypothetical protein